MLSLSDLTVPKIITWTRNNSFPIMSYRFIKALTVYKTNLLQQKSHNNGFHKLTIKTYRTHPAFKIPTRNGSF